MVTLDELIAARREELGIYEAAFVAALGIRNHTKGRALLARIASENMAKMTHLRRPLARVLDLPQARVDAAIETSEQLAEARCDAVWRAAFRPHAVLLTQHARPVSGQLVIALLTGAPGKLIVPLPDGLPLVDWPRRVADRLPRGLPGFGLVTGFALNYAFDNATRFDRNGNPVETLDRAVRRGAHTGLSGISAATIRGNL